MDARAPKTLKTPTDLAATGLIPAADAAALAAVTARYTMAVPPALARLIEQGHAAVARQVIPDPRELLTTPEERIATVTLAEATPDMADMRTVVIVGNEATRRVGRFVYTPRRAG